MADGSAGASIGWDRFKARWKQTARDTSRGGFERAAETAFAAVEAYEWNSLADAADEIALTLGEQLNVGDTGARFVAVHAASGKHRVVYWARRHSARGDVMVRLANAPATGESRS